MRILVALPVLFLLTALVTASFGIELTLRALGPLPLSPVQSLALQKVRLGLIGLGSLGALGLGLLLALGIALPLRRVIQRARACLEAVSPDQLGPAPVNELAGLSTALRETLRAFDKLVTDSQILEGIPEGVLVVDGQGRIKRTNAEARRLLESAGATLEGRELAQVFGREVGQTLAHAVRQAKERGVTVQLPPVPPLERGKGPELSVMVTPFSAAERGEVLAIVTDLTRLPQTL